MRNLREAPAKSCSRLQTCGGKKERKQHPSSQGVFLVRNFHQAATTTTIAWLAEFRAKRVLCECDTNSADLLLQSATVRVEGSRQEEGCN